MFAILTRLAAVFAVALTAVILGMSTSISASASQMDANRPDWYTREIEPLGKQENMQAAAEALAVRAGISLLIEGWPLQKPYLPEKPPAAGERVTVADALTKLADVYDNTWEVSKTGVVLFRKRFSDEHDRPEVTEAELKASVRDILSVIGRTDSPIETTPQTLELLQSIVDALPPEAARQAEGEGLLIGSLPPPLQQQVLRAIYNRSFARQSFEWSRLEAFLTRLPRATIALDPRFDKNPRYAEKILPGTQALSLFCPEPRNLLTRSPLTLFNLDLNPHLKDPNDAPVQAPEPFVPASPAPPSLVRAFTVSEAATKLEAQLRAKVDIAPELRERRLVLLLQQKDTAKGLAALAELHNWSYVTRKQAQGEVRIIRRRAVTIPRQPTEVGAALLSALPADVARILTAPPATLGGKPVMRFPPLPPAIQKLQKGPDSAMEMDLMFRMGRQADRARAEFQLTVAGRDFSSPVAYGDLSEEQKRLVIYCLFAEVGKATTLDLLKAIYHPPVYLMDPLNSRLVKQGDAYGINGSTGGGFMIRKGRPTPPSPQ